MLYMLKISGKITKLFLHNLSLSSLVLAIKVPFRFTIASFLFFNKFKLPFWRFFLFRGKFVPEGVLPYMGMAQEGMAFKAIP